MFIEMSFKCEASFQADTSDNETLAMVWAQSFVNAHSECGYMSKPKPADLMEKMRLMDVISVEQKEKEL
jgi:hypothetical protein